MFNLSKFQVIKIILRIILVLPVIIFLNIIFIIFRILHKEEFPNWWYKLDEKVSDFVW